MKNFVVLTILVFISIVSCDVQIPENLRKAKDISEHPRLQELLRNNFSNKNKNSGVTPFIIGGSIAERGQIPHHVLIFITYPDDNVYLCGGSLIHQKWVLTAAHCVADQIQFVQVFTGVVSIFGPASWGTQVYGNSSNIYIHEEYDPTWLWNDIALIELTDAPEDLLNDPYIGIVDLPFDLIQNELIGRNGTVTGFGRYSDNSVQVSENLKYNTLPVISNEECASVYVSGVVRDTNICAGTTSEASTCGGDSGGSYTLNINGTEKLIGITSFGAQIGCQLGYPAGFTRVTSFLKWIDEKVNKTQPPPGPDFNEILRRILERILEFLRGIFGRP